MDKGCKGGSARAFWTAAAAVAAADRALKIAAFRLPAEGVVLIPGVLAVVPAQNTGMALGLFQNHSYLILIVSVLLVLFSIRLLRRIRPGGLAAASISMIAGGALGNMIDRLAYGYVIDMFKPLFMDFYIFNIADVGVVVGAVLCAVSLRFRPQDWSEA